MRVTLPGVAKCSQMSNPKAGTGSGGDRCTEAVAAMLFCTYVDKSADPEAVMYKITEAWNNGSDVSTLESGTRIEQDIAGASNGAISFADVGLDFESYKAAINRGHPVILGVRDYRAIRKIDGGDPYMWDTSTQPPAGHVTLGIGYDDASEAIIANDPLNKEFLGQPWDYSLSSYQAAGWNSAREVEAPSLLPPAPPAAPKSYTVERGDSLWYIAIKEYGYSSDDAADIKAAVDKLYAANAGVIGSDPDLIRPGQVLVIP